MKLYFKHWLVAIGLFCTAALAQAEEPGLQKQVEDLKGEALELSKELYQLEEELLFPANTQFVIFVSLDIGEFFTLDSVKVEIDGKELTNYLYTEREVDALRRGGVQRIYEGNLRSGEHELVAYFYGKGKQGRDFRRGSKLKFSKHAGPKYLELKIQDWEEKLQPDFDIREWE